MKTIIVTAADEKFSGLLNELLASLFQFDAPLSNAIGILDLGLSSTTREELKNKVNHIIQPEWDLVVDENVAKEKPHLRALTARPFLPKYFPGYDLYLWLDADTWVQNRFAIDWLLKAAATGSMAIVPQVHQSYFHTRKINNWRNNTLYMYYEKNGADLYWQRSYYNAGVFALRGDAPHWVSWAKQFQIGLHNSGSSRVCDQTALNYAIWTEKLQVHPLPALCNWCCHLAIPSVDPNTGKFCEPHIPHRELGIIHMTAKTKDLYLRSDRMEVGSSINLHFRAENKSVHSKNVL